jgi:hypothetical protein
MTRAGYLPGLPLNQFPLNKFFIPYSYYFLASLLTAIPGFRWTYVSLLVNNLKAFSSSRALVKADFSSAFALALLLTRPIASWVVFVAFRALVAALAAALEVVFLNGAQ